MMLARQNNKAPPSSVHAAASVYSSARAAFVLLLAIISTASCCVQAARISTSTGSHAHAASSMAPPFFGRGSAVDYFTALPTSTEHRMQRMTNSNILSRSDMDTAVIATIAGEDDADDLPSTFTSIPTYLQLRGGGGGATSASTTSSMSCSAASSHIIKGGSLSSALATARSQARLLVIYIPTKSKSKAAKSNNAIAETSLNSDEVAVASNTASRRKKGGGADSKDFGSFVVWSPDSPTSSEAAAAMKRLKAKYPGKGRSGGAATSPILLVAYVAQHPAKLDPSTGRPRLLPKVLAQHHCNPPPRPDSMSSWLNTLRKRHVKQYAAMQHHIREARLYTERVRGYVDSQVDDENREMKQKQEEAEAKAKEEEETRRMEAMEQRRAELFDSLPDEPEAGGADTIAIALRFADGRTGRRRFDAEDATMGDVFNWVDAVYKLERERIELSTMTGQRKFVFGEHGTSEMTLRDVGLGKMTGLRVIEIEPEEDAEGEVEDSDEDEEEEHDNEEEEV